MVAINVQIISRETVKPSRPTPQENRTHKLSFFDQFSPPIYTSIVLFYVKPENEFRVTARLNDHLKTSLSNVLTLFYPFAGRVKDDFSIDCNDFGATYVKVNLDVNMYTLIKQPDINLMGQLLPCFPIHVSGDIREQPILAIQVNSFACGGVAIGVCVLHVIADASSVGSFVRTWAACGVAGDIEEEGPVVVDCTSLFPPCDDAEHVRDLISSLAEESPTSKSTIKRLIFEA